LVICTEYTTPNPTPLTSFPSVDIADRISLGLFPTSQSGYFLAVQALSRHRGGYIHVHENMHQQELEIKSKQLIEQFENLFHSLNKPMQVVIEHIETVKSYAPRVYHYVFDLYCTPID
jgi:tRNA wybutosine-synthesizing protein 2